MKRTSLVALLAITLSSVGCTSLCRRNTPAPVAQACVPVGGQGVSYGMPMMYAQ